MKHDGGWKRSGFGHIYQSQWFSLRQDEVSLPNGDNITYTLIEHPGYAMVVPLLDDGHVVMERIYRYTVQETLLECPSGGLDGEPPEVAAGRELEEETGWKAGCLVSLGKYYGSTGISDERFNLYLATQLIYTGNIAREPTEQMEIELIPFPDVVAMAFAGEILDAPSALAVLLANEKLKDTERKPSEET